MKVMLGHVKLSDVVVLRLGLRSKPSRDCIVEGKVVAVMRPGRKGRTGSPGRQRKQIISTTAT
jgi:hypothetical protein